LKTRLLISPVLGVLISVGSAIVLVSIILFVIMCFRVKYEKVSRAVSRRTGQHLKKDMQDRLHVDLSENSPDLIPNNDGKHEESIKKCIKYFIYKHSRYSFDKLLIHLMTLSAYQGDEAAFMQYAERTYSALHKLNIKFFNKRP
jgi:hypothetical protein